MDVFKTHVGEGKALMINEENFYLATRERKPYVVDSGGVKSFYAVCPECDNPIQLIGLLRRQQDSLPHRPYGRHIGHDVPGVAVYDEDAYLSCPFSDPGYWRTDRKRKPSNPTGQALYRIMRTGSTGWNTRGGKAPGFFSESRVCDVRLLSGGMTRDG